VQKIPIWPDFQPGDNRRPESHAFVEYWIGDEYWIGVDALDGDADGTGAGQRAEVVERRVPWCQEAELEVLQLLMMLRL